MRCVHWLLEPWCGVWCKLCTSSMRWVCSRLHLALPYVNEKTDGRAERLAAAL